MDEVYEKQMAPLKEIDQDLHKLIDQLKLIKGDRTVTDRNGNQAELDRINKGIMSQLAQIT